MVGLKEHWKYRNIKVNKFNRGSKECLEPDSCLCQIHFNWSELEEKQFNGLIKKNWINGNSRYELNFKGGKQEGISKSWYSNGNLKQTRNWVSGEWYGLWTDYFENGSKECEGFYRGGKLIGNYTTWYENGNKQYEGPSDGSSKPKEKDGLTTKWYESGQKCLEKTYKDWKEISSKSWDEDGNER